MTLTECNGRLARWRVRISKFGYDICHVKEGIHSLADCMSRRCTTVDTTDEVDQDILCFLADPKGFENSLKHDKPVPVDNPVIDSIFELRVPPDFTPSTITHDDYVREQSLDKFC